MNKCDSISKPFTIKNKLRRHTIYRQQKLKNNREKKEKKQKQEKDRKQFGDKAQPKAVPRTIENTCVFDGPVVSLDDKETLQDEANDEFSGHFSCISSPKVLVTSSIRPSLKTHLLIREFCYCIPNSSILLRTGFDLKKLVSEANSRDYTDIIIINEDRKIPNGILIVHLPEGPSAHFKLSSFRRGYEIKGHGKSTSHIPEIILNNFNTKLGSTVGRMFASLFPYQPHFQGRQVVTFHNQRDYIFFRYHRYIFKNSQRVGMQELGPRFTLKLRSIQKGTFDSKYGEYYWKYKKDDTEKGKKKYYI